MSSLAQHCCVHSSQAQSSRLNQDPAKRIAAEIYDQSSQVGSNSAMLRLADRNPVQTSRAKLSRAQSSQTKLSTAVLNLTESSPVSSVPAKPSQFLTSHSIFSQVNLRPGVSVSQQHSQFHTRQGLCCWDQISLPQRSHSDYNQECSIQLSSVRSETKTVEASSVQTSRAQLSIACTSQALPLAKPSPLELSIAQAIRTRSSWHYPRPGQPAN